MHEDGTGYFEAIFRDTYIIIYCRLNTENNKLQMKLLTCVRHFKEVTLLGRWMRAILRNIPVMLARRG